MPTREDLLGTYEAAVRADPRNLEAWFKLGVFCRGAGNLNAALTCFRAVMELHPGYAAAYMEHGMVLRKQGNIAGARASYVKALQLAPDSVETHFNLGNLFREEGKLDEAAACYEESLRLRPDFVAARNNLGLLLEEAGRLEDALAQYRRAVTIRPDFAGAHINIGNVLKAQNRLIEAVASYRAAVLAAPHFAEAHHSLGLALLASGNFCEGWEEFEWRLRCVETGGRIGARSYSRPAWNGEPLEGKTIFIYTEQGLGDTIQFSRYLSFVKELGAHVLFGTYPDLLRLFTKIPDVDILVDITAPSLPPFDTYAALMSLPRIFKTTRDSIPCKSAYLQPDAEIAYQWSARMDTRGVRVGLVWASNTENRIGRVKSLSWEQMLPLLDVQGAAFFTLQKGNTGRVVSSPAVRDIAPTLTDFAQTAGAVVNLDLIISVDTSVAHLAGALGKPVWTLLPFSADWRWLTDCEDTPWYPSMRLFRQASPGDWTGVIKRVREELNTFVSMKNQGGTFAGSELRESR